MNLRCPTVWNRARHWAEKIRPHVLSNGKLEASVDGGYPLCYLVSRPSRYAHGFIPVTLSCPECASTVHEWGEHDYIVTDAEVNWENGDLWCDCGKRIEAAYVDEERCVDHEDCLACPDLGRACKQEQEASR